MGVGRWAFGNGGELDRIITDIVWYDFVKITFSSSWGEFAKVRKQWKQATGVRVGPFEFCMSDAELKFATTDSECVCSVEIVPMLPHMFYKIIGRLGAPE